MPVIWKSLNKGTEEKLDPSGIPDKGALVLCRRVEDDPTVTNVPGLIPRNLEIPTVFCLQLPENSSLLKEGLPRAGFAIYYTREAKGTFDNVDWICNDLLGDVGNLRFRDDPDWRLLPEVSQVVKSAVLKGVPEAEEDCFCLAMNVDKTCWALGFGTAYAAKRQPAAKLAFGLGVAYATGRLDEISTNYPEFGAMCARAGFVDASFFNKRLTPRQEEARAWRLRNRIVEGGKAGGFNERQEVVERNEFVDTSLIDDFGRRISKPGSSTGDQQAAESKKLSKAERAKAALERLKKPRQPCRSRSRSKSK